MSDIDALQDTAREVEGLPWVEDLVEQWFFDTFHGSLVARTTEVWNAVHAAKEDLKRRLGAHLAASTHSTPKG